jgi:hypothetical protein
MSKLSEDQKYQIITILRDLASIDRNFDLLEAVRIRLIGLKMDLHAAKIDEALSEDFESLDSIIKRLEIFEDEAHKKYLYQQCVLLLLANNEITSEEQKSIDQIQAALSIDQDFHQQVMDWAKQGMAWEEKGQQLTGLSFG